MITAVDLLARHRRTCWAGRTSTFPARPAISTPTTPPKGNTRSAPSTTPTSWSSTSKPPTKPRTKANAQAKVEALERIDRDIVGPLHAHLRRQGDYRILVSPDHPTFLRTKTHSHGYVPFALCGTGITPDAAQTYDERRAAASSLVFDRGCDLMPYFLRSP